MTELDRLLEYVLDRREYCLNYRKQKFDDLWEAALINYNAPPHTRKSGDDLNLPAIYLRTEIMLAHSLADFYGYKKSPLSAFSRSKDTYQLDEKISMLWEYRVRQMDFLLKMEPYFRQCILFGTSIAYLGWDRKYDYVRKEKPVQNALGINVGTQTREFLEEVYSGPCFDVLDIFSTWMDPDAKSCLEQDIADIGHETWMTQDDLWDMVDSGQFSEEAVSKIDFEHTELRHQISDGDVMFSTDKRDSIQDTNAQTFEPRYRGQKAVKVLEWWGRYTPKGSKRSVAMVVTIADPDGQKILLRPDKKFPEKGNNPYNHQRKPFVVFNFVSRDFSPYGKGMGELLFNLNEKYQELSSLRLKNIEKSVIGMTVVQYGSMVNPEEMSLRSNGIIRVNGDARAAINVVQFNEVTQSINIMLGEILQQMDEVSAVDAVMRSAPPATGAKTPISAVEANIRSKTAGRRFSFLIGLMMARGPAKIAKLMLELDKQHIQEETEFMAMKQNAEGGPVHPEYFTITPEELQGNWDFFFVGDPLQANEAIYKNQKISGLGLMLNPIFQAPPNPNSIVKTWEVAKSLCQAIDEPWQDMVIPNESAAQIMAQQIQDRMMMEMAQNQQMQQGIPQQGGKTEGGQSSSPSAPGGGKSMQLPQIPGNTVEGGPPLPPLPGMGSPVSNAPLLEEGGSPV